MKYGSLKIAFWIVTPFENENFFSKVRIVSYKLQEKIILQVLFFILFILIVWHKKYINTIYAVIIIKFNKKNPFRCAHTIYSLPKNNRLCSSKDGWRVLSKTFCYRISFYTFNQIIISLLIKVIIIKMSYSYFSSKMITFSFCLKE